MAEFINTIDVLGDDAVMDSIIERTITEFKDNVIQTIGQYAFYGCTNLVTLVLGSDSVVTLKNANALTNSGIAKGTGYIYVPAALLDTYKAATNWATYANQFRAIEDE